MGQSLNLDSRFRRPNIFIGLFLLLRYLKLVSNGALSGWKRILRPRAGHKNGQTHVQLIFGVHVNPQPHSAPPSSSDGGDLGRRRCERRLRGPARFHCRMSRAAIPRTSRIV